MYKTSVYIEFHNRIVSNQGTLVIVKNTMTIEFIVINELEFDTLVCAVLILSAIYFGSKFEILLALDIKHIEKLFISFKTLIKFEETLNKSII